MKSGRVLIFFIFSFFINISLSFAEDVKLVLPIRVPDKNQANLELNREDFELFINGFSREIVEVNNKRSKLLFSKEVCPHLA